MKQNRWKSPILWGGIFGVVLTEVTALSQVENINGWTIAISILTGIVAIFGVINNPTDKENM